MQRFRQSISTGEDSSVITQDSVDTSTAGDAIITRTADDVVILAIAKDHVVARHAVDDIVARFTVQFVIQIHIVGCTKLVFMILNRARHDLLRSVGIVSELRIA